jgi:xanthine dehydrogenase YagT iron-sulfur-binding subunit
MTRDGKDRDEQTRDERGLSRRGFLQSVGAGALTAAAARPAAAMPPGSAPPAEGERLSKVTLVINGRQRQLQVEPRWSLSYVLRERLGLSGTKVGCERGECGACTVLIEGEPRYACLTLGVEVEGKAITTVEGLMQGEQLGPTQQAFVEEDAYQCGYCTCGQIMAAEGLLRADANPSLDETRKQMSGNLCRCGAYPHIFAAVQRAAEIRKGGAS